MASFEVLGGIGSILTITESAHQLIQTIAECGEAPATFTNAAAKLPLILEVLKTVKRRVEADQARLEALDPGFESTIRFVVSCTQKAITLGSLLEGIKSLPTYRRKSKMVEKQSEVDSLVKELTNDVDFLASTFTLKGATESQADETLTLLRRLSEDWESTKTKQDVVTYNSFGSSTQHNFGAFSLQNYNTGTGKIIVAQSMTLHERDD
ncbi:hypothetical protein ACJ41O_011550 [Fusarium nematophilum]